jgi:hypothetical protein
MEKNKNDIVTIKNIIIAILILLLGISGCSVWSNYKKLKHYEKQVNKLTIEGQSFNTIRTETGKLLAEQEQIILTQKQAIDNGWVAYLKLKKLQSHVKVKTVTQLDSIFIPYTKDSIVMKYDTVYVDTTKHFHSIKVPRKFSILDEYYAIGGRVKKEGVVVDSLKIFNTMNVNIGLKSQGFFKRPKPIVMVDYDNPYVNTLGLSNIIIKDEKKFYDRKFFWFGLGLVSGITTTALLIK